MSWKKNTVSYLIWFMYTVAVSGLLAGMAGVVCVRKGAAVYWGILAAVIVLLGSGNLVLFLHRFAGKISSFAAKNRKMLYALEAVLAAAFFVIGIFFRIEEMDGAFRPSAYYEAAKVAQGQRIPQIVHGAVYLYVHLLHAAYLLLGNYFSAGLWVQILLQLTAVLLFYFTVRRLFGSVAALVVLGFCTLGTYMVGNALVLSPDSLFFLLLSGAAALLTARHGKKLIPVLFFPAGILAAFCAYMDVMGTMLLFLAGAVIFNCRREEAASSKKVPAVLFCLLGAVSGFFAACGMDAFLSGKSFTGVLEAWALLYRPQAFRLPVTGRPGGGEWEGMFLLAVMTAGIFSFWCDKKEEQLSPFVLGAACILTAACFGIFTAEMPGGLFLYLSAVLCAGTGLGQCFAVPAAEKAEQYVGQGDDGKMEDKRRGTAAFKAESQEAENGKMSGEISGAQKTSDTKTNYEQTWEEDGSEPGAPVQYIKNPLPLPKKHRKRVLDYPERNYSEKDDFDHPVSEDDDFDI